MLALFVVIAYIPAISADYVWDDAGAITDNQHNKSLRGLFSLWTDPANCPLDHYWPLTFTSFWLEYQLWGEDPSGYHIVNILLHALNAILVFVVLRRMIGMNIGGAWFAAALFALHPMQVESVAWVIERKNLLSFLFYLLAALSYERYIRDGAARFYRLTLFLFSCALFAKTLAITFPVSLLIWHWYRRDRIGLKLIGDIALFMLIGIGIALLHLAFFLPKQPASQMLFTERLLVATRSLVFYATKLLFPHPLMTIYPRWDVGLTNLINWLYTGVVIIVIVILYFLRQRIGRGALAGILFFIVTLAPIINIIDQPYYSSRIAFVNDHAVYFGSLGIFALAGAAMSLLWRKVFHKKFNALLVAGSIILLILSIMTWKQASLYKNIETLFADAVAKNPVSAPAHYNLGRALHERNDLQQAMYHYKKAIELDPVMTESRMALGAVLFRLGDFEGAEILWKAVGDEERDRVQAYYNLAALYILQQRWDDALKYSKAVLQLKPDLPDAYLNMGIVLFGKKMFPKAISYLNRALLMNPDLVNAHINLAKALMATGNNTLAIEHLEKALQIAPDDLEVLTDLVGLYRQVGDLQKARERLAVLLKLQSDNPLFFYRAAILDDEMNDTTAAVSHFREALRLRPDWIEAMTNLAWILATSTDDTVRNGQEALRLASRANVLSGGNNPLVLDTLAAAYAECGDFDMAQSSLQKALSLAQGKQPEEWLESRKQILLQYQLPKPYRE